MFNNPHYITRGVKEDIPLSFQLLMWGLIADMNVKEKDYLQVFQLSQIVVGGETVQKVTHTQEKPPYKKDHIICAVETPVTAKIFVIDDTSHSTMLLASEY